MHFAAIDEEGYLQHWSQDLVTEDLAGSIARLLAWHREDGLAKGLSAIERAEVLSDELAAALPAAVREAEASKDDRLTMLLAAVAGSVAALRCGLAERRSS